MYAPGGHLYTTEIQKKFFLIGSKSIDIRANICYIVGVPADLSRTLVSQLCTLYTIGGYADDLEKRNK